MSFVSVFFFKQKTAYEMRISDWSSCVCSSYLRGTPSDEYPVRILEQMRGRTSFSAGIVEQDKGLGLCHFASLSLSCAQVEDLTAVKRVRNTGKDRKSVV